MIRKLAILLLLLAIGYVGWVVVLNLGGDDGGPVTASADRRPPQVAPPASTAPRVAAPPGVLVVPVAGIRPDQLSDTFDDARGQGRVHDAIDIMAPRGTAVIAAAAGTVEKLFDSKLGGRTIYVRRPGGQWVDYYAHLDGYAPGLAEGRQVAQGEMIGMVGSTGDASPEAPHLHYAINAMAPGEGWWQGKAINPYPLLKAGR
ncbi:MULTISPECIES: M23 family metallopeptidase [unclassified Sphingomonas]|uniref:M23 family metallopeptidase n=1 Tax=unclassified Sphingomonas TaxID=196159 RepID=UPI0006F9753E|nr:MULTISPECIES: M23 family metallopeptidase [unclassified Sphingomonas]KQX17703.1 peptidase M23 [Sphingomonas sp. Root1294]KQY70629.1 peptidase M23 [Sphingomonas sp. Root50]KRB91879.1 peptidase M23 [Sphingomonas sp. Root720]